MILFCFIVILGAKATSIDIVFGVIGATSGSIISLILPGLFYIKLTTE